MEKATAVPVLDTRFVLVRVLAVKLRRENRKYSLVFSLSLMLQSQVAYMYVAWFSSSPTFSITQKSLMKIKKERNKE